MALPSAPLGPLSSVGTQLILGREKEEEKEKGGGGRSREERENGRVSSIEVYSQYCLSQHRGGADSPRENGQLLVPNAWYE